MPSGLFDDLIPPASKAPTLPPGSGLFDDLVPQNQGAPATGQQGGMFDDLVPASAPAAPVVDPETMGQKVYHYGVDIPTRAIANGVYRAGRYLNGLDAAAMQAVGAGIEHFAGQNPVTDFINSNAQRGAQTLDDLVQQTNITPQEKQSLPAQIEYGTFGMVPDLALAAATGGAGEAAPLVRTAGPALAEVGNAALHGMRSFAAPSVIHGGDAAYEVAAQGASPQDQALAALKTAAVTDLSAALPMQVTSGLANPLTRAASRVAQAYPLSVAQTEVGRILGNFLPGGQQEPTMTDNVMAGNLPAAARQAAEAIPGALLGVMGGQAKPGIKMPTKAQQELAQAERMAEQARQAQEAIDAEQNPQRARDKVAKSSASGEALKGQLRGEQAAGQVRQQVSDAIFDQPEEVYSPEELSANLVNDFGIQSENGKPAEKPPVTPKKIVGHKLVERRITPDRKDGKRGKTVTRYDVVELLENPEGGDPIQGDTISQGRGRQISHKIKIEADRKNGVGKPAPAKNDGGWSENPLIQLLNGRIMSKTVAKKKGRYEGLEGEYDGTKDMLSDPTHNSIYGGSLTPDLAVEEAISEGHLPPGSKADDLWAKIAEISAASKRQGREDAKRQKWENEQIKQAEKEQKKQEAELKKQKVEKSETDVSDIPEDASTDFLPPDDTATETPAAPEAVTPEEIALGKERLAKLEASGRGNSEQAQRLRKALEDAGYGEKPGSSVEVSPSFLNKMYEAVEMSNEFLYDAVATAETEAEHSDGASVIKKGEAILSKLTPFMDEKGDLVRVPSELIAEIKDWSEAYKELKKHGKLYDIAPNKVAGAIESPTPEGQLIPEKDMPFSLSGEVDSSQTPAEKAAADAEAARAAEAEKAQMSFFEKADAWADKTIKEAPKRMNMMGNPELVAAVTYKGARILARGITDFTKWSAEMVKEFGNSVRPYLRDIYNRCLSNPDEINRAAEAYASGPKAVARQNYYEKLKAGFKNASPKAIARGLHDFGQISFASNAARFETLIARLKDNKPAQAAAQKIADLLQTSPGKDRAVGTNTYHEDVSTRRQQFANKISRAFDPFNEDFKMMTDQEKSDFMTRAGQLLTDPASKNLGGRFGKLLDDLRGITDELLQYQKDAGIEIGERDNYVKRVLNERAVLDNQQKFLRLAAKVYENDGMKPEDAQKAAEAYYAAILHRTTGATDEGVNGLRMDGLSNGMPNHTKSRTLGASADVLLKDFYYRDIQDILANMVHGAVNHAEFTRRFGKNGEKYTQMEADLVKHGADAETIKEIREIVKSQIGAYSTVKSKLGRNITDGISLVNLLGFMARSTYSSLSEPITIAQRSGKVRDLFPAYLNSLKETINIIRKSDPSDQALLAEDLGLISASMNDQLLASRFMMDESPQANAARRIGNGFMRRIGLLQWTEGTKVTANLIAQRHINRVAEDIAANRRINLATRELRTLGVSPADAPAFIKFVKSLASAPDTRAAVMADTPEAAMYRRALVRFNRESILEPSAADRARPATNPVYRTAFGLMGYLYSFSRNVIGRNMGMFKDAINPKNDYAMNERAALLKPLLFMGLSTATQMGLGELRDILWNDPSRAVQPEKSFRSKMWMAVSRANLLGKWDLLFNLFDVPGTLNSMYDSATGSKTPAGEARRYQRDPATALLGPTLGLASEGFQSGVNLMSGKNSPNTNTGERKAARVAYDIFAKPTFGAIGATAPGGLLGAAIIQAANHPYVRESFVKTVAGPAAPAKVSGGSANGRGVDSRSAGRGYSGRQTGR